MRNNEKDTPLHTADDFLKKANEYLDTDNYGMAIMYYSKVIDMNPKCINALLNRGVAYHNNEKYDLAIKDYRKVIEEIDSKNENALINLALARMILGEYEKAKGIIKRVFELNPENADAFYLSGLIYIEEENIGAAIRDLKDAIHLGLDGVFLQEANSILNSPSNNIVVNIPLAKRIK
jgi:tetratricopeptide (TPR) repeat protein